MSDKKEFKVKCPICGHPLNFHILHGFDFLGEGSLIAAFFCPKCGYKGIDVFPERMKEPIKLIYNVDNEKKLNTLLVRSSRAKITIPEIGASIEPGPASTGFITTVEGILYRFLDVFGEEKIGHIIKPLMEKAGFTLIIEDPSGTSAIDSKEVRKEKLIDERRSKD